MLTPVIDSVICTIFTKTCAAPLCHNISVLIKCSKAGFLTIFPIFTPFHLPRARSISNRAFFHLDTRLHLVPVSYLPVYDIRVHFVAVPATLLGSRPFSSSFESSTSTGSHTRTSPPIEGLYSCSSSSGFNLLVPHRCSRATHTRSASRRSSLSPLVQSRLK